ncbi:MAG: hypothetical protein KDA24_07180 [Deltaproteobacteria bacterium]|nr:hypothetical protein [Deltaproteobacteria bacterium]
MHRLLLCLAALALAAPLVGCADNSGGPPPDGTALEEFTSIAMDPGGLFCDFFRDDAFLIHDGSEAADFLANDCAGNNQEVQDAVVAVADDLEEGEAIVVVSVQLGGCLGEWGVHGFYMSEDESTVTAWVLRGDSAYGKQNVACPADIGGAIELYRVMDAAAATEADILVGPYNPGLPGAPAQPG